MYNAHYQRGRIHTNEHLLLFLPWGKEIYQISIVPKQALINAFLLCLQTDSSDCVAKIQQNLRMCKFWEEKVLGVFNVFKGNRGVFLT
jgi:hypothetical protein